MKAPLNQDQARAVGVAIAGLRAGVGAVTLVAPSLARLWVRTGGASSPGKVLSRLAGADLSVGVATVLARDHPRRLAQSVAAAAFADATDALGAWAAFSFLPVGPGR